MSSEKEVRKWTRLRAGLVSMGMGLTEDLGADKCGSFQRVWKEQEREGRSRVGLERIGMFVSLSRGMVGFWETGGDAGATFFFGGNSPGRARGRQHRTSAFEWCVVELEP